MSLLTPVPRRLAHMLMPLSPLLKEQPLTLPLPALCGYHAAPLAKEPWLLQFPYRVKLKRMPLRLLVQDHPLTLPLPFLR